jgi:3-hydroxyacyl-CoA dehydrogenase
MMEQIENCSKPVVMAIHVAAVGAGLELVMSGHYRVARTTAQFGHAEVRVGLIPGAGGTQLLPRLVGVSKAVEMCAEGNAITAPQAFSLGLIERLVDEDLLMEATASARGLIGKGISKTRERNHRLGTLGENERVFKAAREKANRRERGRMAPLFAIDAIEASTKVSFEEGSRVESKLFEACLCSSQCRALLHVFFAERAAGKIPNICEETATVSIDRVGVVGGGTMGTGIAMAFAGTGIPVLLQDVDQDSLDRALTGILQSYDDAVRRGHLTEARAAECVQLISPALGYAGFEKVDLVIEAVFENVALKKDVFRELDVICKSGAILATNTSTLPLDSLASATGRPQSVVGIHFFNPANVMKLLEIVRGEQTSPSVIASCMQLAKKLGKIGVLICNRQGLAGNRMFHVYRREAQFLVEEGASIQTVDNVLCEFGMAMGPFVTSDLVGLDLVDRVRTERAYRKTSGRDPIVEGHLINLGRYGRKALAGWYAYDKHNRPIPDPRIQDLTRKWAIEAGVRQREVGADEIVERCIYGMVNEGARIIEEGGVCRARDIDVIYVNGYGFPRYLGGPMWYADTIGVQKVYQRICEFHQIHGAAWEPARLLRYLAEKRTTFADLPDSQW